MDGDDIFLVGFCLFLLICLIVGLNIIFFPPRSPFELIDKFIQDEIERKRKDQ